MVATAKRLMALAKRGHALLAEEMVVAPSDVASVLKAGPMMCVIACLNASVYALVAWSAHPSGLLLGWLVVTLCLFVKILRLSEKARRRGVPDRPVSRRARRRMIAFAMVQAAPWAFLGLVFLRSGAPQIDSLTPLVCAGMAISGAMISCRVVPVALTYCFTILGALLVSAVIHGLAHYWPYVVFCCALGPAVAFVVITTAKAVRERDTMLGEVSAKNRELREAQEKITRLAYEDGVTGLPNRQALTEALPGRIEAARAKGVKLGFLLLDLDRFKNINDTLGHHVGDQLLNHVAEQLRATLRGVDDMAARLGGDEFAVVIEAPNAASAERLAHRIRERIVAPIRLGGVAVHPDTSIGLALCPDDADTAADLMMRADIALYRAKEQGKGRVAAYDPGMAEAVSQADEIERDLRSALAQRSLTLHYQPKIDVASGAIRGAEALLRWPDAPRGASSPNVFLPVAAERGLILEITKFVCARLADDLALFRGLTPEPAPIAVNIHPMDLKTPRSLLERLDELRERGVSMSEIVVEITEGCVVGRGSDAASAALDQLDEMGVMLSLDDFGTGHASLSNLRRLPVREIKIDRSFVSGLCENKSDRAIVSSAIELARCMGLASVAEGVETERQLTELRKLGCPLAQGYLFSAPVEREAYAELLQRWGVRPRPLRA